jgi:hypothetical protein
MDSHSHQQVYIDQMGVAAENKPEIKLKTSYCGLENHSFHPANILKCTPSQI